MSVSEVFPPRFTLPKAPGLGDMEMDGTVGATPLPVRLSVTETAPVVETVSTADSAPSVAGVKINFTVQVPPGARTVPLAHVPVPASVKSVEFVPVMVLKGVASVPATFPMLVIVTVCIAEPVPWVTEPKGRGDGTADTVTTAAIPVPDKGRDAEALPAMFKVAERAPAEAGLNLRVTVHEDPVPIIFPFEHVPAPVLVTSAALVPLNVKYGVLSVRFPVPVELTVTVWILLFVPTI